MVENNLYQWLIVQPALTDIVGDKIYPTLIPQGEGLPFVGYGRSGGNAPLSLSGERTLVQPRFLFNAYAENYSQARKIGDILVNLFNGFTGEMDGLRVSGGQALQDGRDDYSSELETPFREVEVSFWIVAA